MIDKRLRKIFYMLTQSEYQSAESLAEQLNLSSRTVRNLLKELNELLGDHGAQIISRYGCGYKLKIHDSHSLEAFKSGLSSLPAEQYLPCTSPERVRYLLDYLFNSRSYVKLDDLSESLFISKRTLTSDLKEVEKRLNLYNLRLIRKPNYGIKVEGKEFDLRLCIASCAELGLSEENESMKPIGECIFQTLQEHDFVISNVAFQNLIVHIYIAIRRIRENHYIPIPTEHLEQLTGRREYQVAKDIITKLNNEFSIVFPPTEVAYIAIHLAGKMLLGQEPVPNQNLVITQEISDLVTDMLQLVYDAFKFDFRDDLELRMSLSQHIVPLAVRVKYDMNMKNPLLGDVKEKFCLAYAMACHACTVINEHFITILKDDEIGYIAFAFALALERKKTQIVKKNILLVCSSGHGSAQLLLYKYRDLFGSYLNHIETCDVCSLHKVDFTNIDYVFSTVPIPVKVPVPIQEVQYFLQSDDIEAVKKMLVHKNCPSVMNYYKKELFLPRLSCSSKEEALRYMCDLVIRERNLPPEFYTSVLKRERLAQTAFGNMVAMPHPFKAMSRETFVCVAILDHPVCWGGQEVQVIFLISIENKNQTSIQLQEFFEITSKFLLSSKCIQELIKKRSYDSMIDLLSKVKTE